MIPMVGGIVLIGFGVVQCLWMIPAQLWYREMGQNRIAKGLLVAAIITFLCWAGCTAFLMKHPLDF